MLKVSCESTAQILRIRKIPLVVYAVSLILGLHGCTLPKPAAKSATSSPLVATATGAEQPLPDLINCYLTEYQVEVGRFSGLYSEQIDSYYSTGQRPAPIFKAEKISGFKYKATLDVRSSVVPERYWTDRNQGLRQRIENLRSSKYEGVWSGDLQDTTNYCDGSNINLTFTSPFWEYENKSWSFIVSGVLNWGLLKNESGILFTTASDPTAPPPLKDSKHMGTQCLVYSREIPAPFAKVFLNGDHRFAMRVESLVAGTPARPEEAAPNYLIVTEMAQTVVDFMKKRQGTLADYVPVTNADGHVVGWLTHVAQDRLFKGLIETVHGPKFRDPKTRDFSPSRGKKGMFPMGTEQMMHRAWQPDLASPAYQNLLSNCSLMIQLATASRDPNLRPVVDGQCDNPRSK